MRFEITEPSTGRVVEVVPGHTAGERERRVALAERAQVGWASTPIGERAGSLSLLADLLEERADDMAHRMAREMGKPIAQGVSEARKCAWALRFYAEHGPGWCADEPIDVDGASVHVRHDPLGVILAVMPWNFPYWQLFRFLAPALVAGNGALIKHAASTPGIALHVESLCLEAGLPRGLVQAMLIDHRATAELIDDARVAAVTLTGSSRAGATVARAAGGALKKTVLELGGSDPFVVLDDADVAEAARVGAESRLLNAGQSCIAAKRFIVHRGIAEAFLRALRHELASYQPGDPYDPETRLGPMARGDLRDALHQQVLQSCKLGAEVRLGGEPPDAAGFAYPPTLLTSCAPGMPAWDEELFGPVAAVREVADDGEALEEANRTVYGLGASVWTQDRERAGRFIEGLRSGSVFVNGMTRSDPRVPFGGVGRSGYGRELGIDGLREWVNRKTVWIEEG